MPKFSLPDVLRGDRDEEAVARLKHYYKSQTKRNRPLFSGSTFDTFAPDRNPRDAFTGEDFLATGLLGVHVPGEAIVKLLHDEGLKQDLEYQLQRLPSDVDLSDLNEAAFQRLMGAKDSPGFVLWDMIRGNPAATGSRDHVRMGPTLTSKLLARKRPRLMPIWDSRVSDQIGMTNSADHWIGMWEVLTADNDALRKRLVAIRANAQIDASKVSLLRTFDVVVWHADKYKDWSEQDVVEFAEPADDPGEIGDAADAMDNSPYLQFQDK
ncbi:DUF6308 family protein [Brachybacterium paraconglomeratum]